MISRDWKYKLRFGDLNMRFHSSVPERGKNSTEMFNFQARMFGLSSVRYEHFQFISRTRKHAVLNVTACTQCLKWGISGGGTRRRKHL